VSAVLARPEPSFYAASEAELEGRPGTLIRRVELEAPDGLRGWAVLYRSLGVHGATVPVSGLVLAPSVTGSLPSSVIAWAHGTTGIADACAPSRQGLAGVGLEGLVALVRAGMVLTATDYEGLGTVGTHPYLVGESEARSILDGVRVLQDIPEVSNPGPVGLVGISQGGHAVLWAAEEAPTYAADLDLRGVVAASPPIDLAAVQAAVYGHPAADGISWIEALLVATAWQDTYDIDVDGYLTAGARGYPAELRERCPWELPPPTADPFTVDPAARPEWVDLMRRNSPGRAPSRAPILALAATRDEQVPPSTIEPGIARLRAAGSEIDLRWIEGDHASTLLDPVAAFTAVSWLVARLRS
jgi:dienelactone hydrolase